MTKLLFKAPLQNSGLLLLLLIRAFLFIARPREVHRNLDDLRIEGLDWTGL